MKLPVKHPVVVKPRAKLPVRVALKAVLHLVKFAVNLPVSTALAKPLASTHPVKPLAKLPAVRHPVKQVVVRLLANYGVR